MYQLNLATMAAHELVNLVIGFSKVIKNLSRKRSTQIMNLQLQELSSQAKSMKGNLLFGSGKSNRSSVST